MVLLETKSNLRYPRESTGESARNDGRLSKGRPTYHYHAATNVLSSGHQMNETRPLLRNSPNSSDGVCFSFFRLSISLILICFVLVHIHKHHVRTAPLHQTSNTHHRTIIRPGQIFYDTDGEPINAHGGGFLYYNNTYYWYGEIKSGNTYLPEANADWGGTRVDLVGISCYASNNLVEWRKCSTFNVLPAVFNDVSSDLYYKNVAERPKVVYNGMTGKFVMWLHVDSMDYSRARCGVAVADCPEGPFEYLYSLRPNAREWPTGTSDETEMEMTSEVVRNYEEGQMARDLTLFVDDGKAYLFTSSEDNGVLHVSMLTDDYLSTTGQFARIFVGRYTEAPTVFKRDDGKYYFIGSGCTAWNPNAARSAVSSSVWGDWTELGNPCRDSGEGYCNTTFHSQSSFVIRVPSFNNSDEASFIYAGDRWKPDNLSDSRYVWLPITFEEDTGYPIVRWLDEWSIDIV